MTGPALPIALIVLLVALAGAFIVINGLGGRRRSGSDAARGHPNRSRGSERDVDDRTTRPIPPPGPPPRRDPGGVPDVGDPATRVGFPDPEDAWDDANHHTASHHAAGHHTASQDTPDDPDGLWDILPGQDRSADETAKVYTPPAPNPSSRAAGTSDDAATTRTATRHDQQDRGRAEREPVDRETVDDAWGDLASEAPTMRHPAAPADPPTTPAWLQEEASDPGQPPLRLTAVARTRAGRKGPNEDAFVVTDGLLAVADGVGGHAAGQVAATLAVSSVAGDRPQHALDPNAALRRAVARANQVVRDRPREQPDLAGMACTLDVVVLGRRAATGATLTIAHVGDSTVWLQPGRGRPRQVTHPHSIAGGPLLNAIGQHETAAPDICQEAVAAGDRIIMATDGLTKVFTVEQLDGLFTELGQSPPEAAADALLAAAVARGTRDDTTIVVADLAAEPATR
jgi:PPM family protein phosphatase